MNIFRFAGDMCHLLSFFVLLHKIHRTRSCKGISLRTQELYAIVFITRYLDLFTNFVSLYNTCMKIIFIAATLTIIYYMRNERVVSVTYDKDRDTFRSWTLVLASAVLALIFHERIAKKGAVHYVLELLWTMSIYLESVAIFPQLVLLQRTQNIDNLTGNYVFLLGMYRALYIINWIFRYFTEPHFVHWLVWLAGLVQTVLYADFFYYYVRSWHNNEKLQLPA